MLSNNLSSGQRKFLDGRRLSFTELTAKRSFSIVLYNIAPGPGSYRAPSEFGQYDIKKDIRISSANTGERGQNISSKTDRTKATQNWFWKEFAIYYWILFHLYFWSFAIMKLLEIIIKNFK